MEPGELLTRWTVRVAVSFYLLSLLLRWARPVDQRRLYWARFLWTGGYLVFLAHIACAFQVFHHWSHWSAHAETARRTKLLMGLSVGAGVYVNYLFMFVWGADVVSWHRLGTVAYQRRPPWLEATIQAFLGFIVFNGTIIFNSGVSRWIGTVGCLSLGAMAWNNRNRAKPASTNEVAEP